MALTQVSTAGVKDNAVTAGKIPADAIGSSEIAANAVGSSELADNAVDTAAIAADAVTGAKIADDTINSEHYAAGSIDTAHIADANVTTAKIADGAVTADKLSTNSVQTTRLVDDAVTTGKIADNAVDMNKLSDLDNGRIIARVSSGSGNPEAATAAQVRTVLNVADGANQTTINNNADNRIITGSDTANTLGGEGNLTFDGTTLSHGTGGLHNGQKFQILGSGNSSGDDLTINNWGNTDGDYWTIGVNCTANSGGSLSKTTDALRHSAIIMDGRMGRVIFNASETSTSTRSDTHTFNRDGALEMKGSLFLNGDTAAANALSDYEEGTWTPTFQYWDGSTYQDVTFDDSLNYSYGHYVKIGKLVHLWYYSGQFSTDSGMNTQPARISGLPFVFKNASPYYGGVFHFIHTNCFKDDGNNLFDCHGGYAQYNTNAFYPSIGNSSGQARWGSESGRYLMMGATYHSNV